VKKLIKLGLNISFGAATLVPLAGLAFAAPREDRDDVRHHRYWDSDHHDYHRWNRDEDRRWHAYWTRDRGPFISWERANEEQRRAYWRWRHEHR
jgi:hypothetical protein